MDSREAEALVDRRPAGVERPGATEWKLCLSALSLSLAALGVFYFDTFRSIVAIWSRSDTYVHGYFVVPITLYLIWIQRDELLRVTPRIDARALVLIALSGAGWLAARLGGVLVAEQYFAVAIIPLMVWAITGSSLGRRILFPLLYLLLLVPVGEALIPHLIDYTAAFAVAALRATGIPVHQQANLLTLPNSQWSVVEACSGLRYLIACITIGLVFAYLTYRSWARRAAFVALSIAVPIVANWVRAYLIILIGYLSSMRLAVGVDHLIYGWIFYAAVMLLLLWVGSKFSDEKTAEKRPAPPEPSGLAPTPFSRTLLMACGAVFVAALWPAWASYADAVSSTDVPSVIFRFPETVGSWERMGKPELWEPEYVGAGFAEGHLYGEGSARVGLHVAVYAESRQGAELITSANSLVRFRGHSWRLLSFEQREVALAGGPLDVKEASLTGPRGEELLVWKWYSISGRRTASDVWGKALEAREKLMLRRLCSAGIVVFTERDDLDLARARLEQFVGAGVSAIDSALEEVSK
jgi:exosortase A